MGRARLQQIFKVAGVCLLGLMPSAAAAEGWAPTVATTNAAVNLALPTPIPTPASASGTVPVPLPPPMPTVTAVPPLPRNKPANATAPSAAVRADTRQAGPAQAKTAAAARNGEVIVPPLNGAAPAAMPIAETGAITTGSIDSIEQTRTLSAEDSARIPFVEADDAATSDITTGAVEVEGSDLARGYCVSVADAASDARVARQRAKLAELEKQINARIAALEAKTAEYKSWVERRDEFLQRVTGRLVQIYTQMEPEAAALQLVSMDEETAAALLTKLDPQSSSSILNEMQPDKAARLTATIAGAARTPQNTRSKAPVAAAPQGPSPAAGNPGEGRS